MVISVAFIWLFKRAHLPPILAYLVAGVVVGPELLDLFAESESMHLAAEVGIVLLLFTLGLEFSLAKLMAMRRLVFGVGGGQMFATTALFAIIALLWGQDLSTSIILGALLGLSSTAIVIKTIDDKGRLNTRRSQIAISVLLFQDLAVVPLLIIIPLLAQPDGQSITTAVLLALLKGVIAVTALLSFGKWLLPRIYNEIARTQTEELFVLTTLVITLLAAGATYAFGLSMALGAFLAGMMLSESQYRHQLEADIRPFRDILMGLFFITVGMQLKLDVVFSEWYWILLGVGILVVAKAAVIKFIGQLYQIQSSDAWAAGFKLAQIGEFSFVLAALAADNNVISTYQSNLIISVGLVSMAITPSLIDKSDWLSEKLSFQKLPSVSPENRIQERKIDAVILGFGRVGQTVARMMKLEGLQYVVIDSDPIRVQEARTAGEDIYYGDATKKDILKKAIGRHAQLSIVTFDNHARAKTLIHVLRDLFPDIKIIVRTRKDYHADELYKEGALQVVPEIQEGSLMLISQVLHYAGIPMSRILKRIRNERQKGYVHMHGFFPGETTEISFETRDKLEFMHAVVITENAFADGKTLDELGLSNKRVQVVALRRDLQEVENPPLHTKLRAKDVLVISGKPRRVERIEKYILGGG